MSDDDDAIAARLDALTAEYHRHLPERIASLDATLAAAHSTQDNSTHINDLVFTLHKLAGSGATFGYNQLSVVARRWEKLLLPAVKQHKSLTQEELKPLAPMIEELRKAIAARTPD